MYKQENRWLDFNWRPADEVLACGVSANIRRQLLKTGSLTCNLECQTQRKFRVELINSGWFYAKPSEAKVLGMLSREKAWVREVFIRCDHEIWVYAWSVFPPSTLIGKYKSLQRVGCRSLDKILFNQPDVQRSEFQLVQIEFGNPIYHKVMREETVLPDALWARRSCYKIDNKPLLMSEVFLPRVFK